MARVKVFTDRGWIEIPPPFTDISVIEDKRIQVTSIRGFVSFTSTNEYLSEYGERSRPKGEWKKSEQNPNELYCSECKGIHNDKTGKWRETFTYKYAFCPLCGADMRGKE